MKRLTSILMVMAVMIAPDISEAQNQITRPSKKRTEQEAILQNLINNMVYVEGGSFMMGAYNQDAYDDEKPAHREVIGSFYIGRYEVTQKEWNAVMGNNPSKFKGESLPVECVSWDDCQKFIQKLNKLTGRNFRLPTEEEWEYAARGGNRSNGYKYSGSNDINNVAWYDATSGEKTHNVGTKGANELGLYDMTGNVWEWTSSNWNRNYNSPRNSSEFVSRGSAWYDHLHRSRITNRIPHSSTSRGHGLGLRLAL